jgi:hypothetical protein
VADSESPQEAALPEEITKSMVSVWKRYSDESPSGARTEIEGDVVRCVLEGAVGDFNKRMTAAQSEGGPEPDHPLTPASYRRDATGAIARVTRRRVLGFVSDHDATTDIAREVFMLEPRPRRY